MAASAGGLEALSVVLRGLPAKFPAAIAIVMHLSPDHKSILAEILNRRTPLVVKQAHTGDVLCPACVFVAPPNHHLFVAQGGKVIAQDRPSSQDFSMPETSIKTGDVDFILPLDAIAGKLIALVAVAKKSPTGRKTATVKTKTARIVKRLIRRDARGPKSARLERRK